MSSEGHEYLQEYHMHMRAPDMPGNPKAAEVAASLQKISERLRSSAAVKERPRIGPFSMPFSPFHPFSIIEYGDLGL